MAEKEGIGSLPYYEDPEALELARKASEQMMSQEMDLEFDKELPPAMRTGGIYALFTDLGKSLPNLEYHTFGTVPAEARVDFAEREKFRKELGYDKLKEATPYYYPEVSVGEKGGSVLGLFMPESIKQYADPKNREEREEMAEKYNDPRLRIGDQYKIRVSPRGFPERPEKRLVGESLANMEAQSFQVYDVEPGQKYPGFLTGPSLPSVNVELNEMLLPFPEYQPERATTYKHELLHAGANHPRFKEFQLSEDFKQLPDKVRTDFYKMAYSQHRYTGPLKRYAENYREGQENNVVQYLVENADALLSPDALKQGLDQEGQDTAVLMLQAIEKGEDPLHQYARRVGFDAEDRKLLNDLETMSLYFGEYLNRTADPETGKQAYTAVKKLEEKVPR